MRQLFQARRLCVKSIGKCSNLHFARAAEAAGVLRWALSAYERVTVNDPGNAEAQAGLQRVRRKLQPDYSQVTVELGSTVESNPRYYLGPRRTEVEGLASASLRDERAINGLRWRTTGAVAGQIYSQSGDLGYGYAGLYTGPCSIYFPACQWCPRSVARPHTMTNIFITAKARSARLSKAHRKASINRCN